ncbi:Halotolerance protein 9 [Pichia kudriavzevii]|nr:Halotolerance protein 9 [Pichia kudriavzevii]
MQFPSIDLRTLVEKLRDNALFYYNKTLIISGGLNSITSCLLLAEYADFTSSSRAAYTISNTAIRHAQDLGLHLENTYRGLNPKEKVLRLNVWWACYAIDKEMCIRWGQPPVLSDRDISAPPLSGFEPFWSSNVSSKKRSKRFVHGLEIKSTLESLSGNMYDITVMEQFVTTDYALLISKIHSSFLQANSLKHLSNKDVSLLKDSLLNELECWRNNIPEEL